MAEAGQAPWRERWERDGWTVRYTPLGGRADEPWLVDALSSLEPQTRAQIDDQTANALIATNIAPVADLSADITYFVAVARKLLQRGRNPRVPTQIPEPHAVNAGRLRVAAAGPMNAVGELDPSIRLDPVYEAPFWTMLTEPGKDLARYVVPQPSFESLTGVDGGERWADFLIAPPWLEQPLVVELDGQQHAEAAEVDGLRDAALKRAGFDVLRARGSELSQGESPLRRRLGALHRQAPPPDAELLQVLHGPPATTRLGIALLELLEAGVLKAGGDWAVELDLGSSSVGPDTTGVLSLFEAIDLVWDLNVSPKTLRTVSESPGVARIVLDPFVPAWHRLEDDGRPAVVIRGFPIKAPLAWLPIPQALRRDVDPGSPGLERGLRMVLHHLFGHGDFREGQVESITSALAGEDACVLLPTGAGKSLIYQIAGLLKPGVTLVLDPLTSLVDDQERRLIEDGIDRVVAVHAGKAANSDDRERIHVQIADGDALFAFITPERLQIQAFRDALAQATEAVSINLAVIDEAHCVSEWGHDFRTAYLRVGRNVRKLCCGADDVPPPLLAMTGTASPAVLRDVRIELEASPGSMVIQRPGSFDRKNLSYEVLAGQQSDWPSRLRAALTESIPQVLRCEVGDLIRLAGAETRSGLVFVPHRNGAFGIQAVQRRVLEVLRPYAQEGEVVRIGIYSGGAPRELKRAWDKDKVAYAKRFKDNLYSALVTTKAFGMGIDKPNIRWTVHVGYPASLEGFAQEAGRAGRDGQPACCLLLASPPAPETASRLLDLQQDREARVAAFEEAQDAEESDLTRQYFFLTQNYTGVDDELSTVFAILEQLLAVGPGNRAVLPREHGFDSEGADPVERALYRLAMVGVVDDYTIDYGGKKFVVDLECYNNGTIDDALSRFVARVEPGRTSVRNRQVAEAPSEFLERAKHHLRLLVETLYDVIEPARVRALTEMHQFATAGETDAQLRQRLLAYLSDGPLAGILNELATADEIDIRAATAALDTVPAVDPREWVGTAGRQLEAYPDHPMLLVVRALGESLLESADMSLLKSTFSGAFAALAGYGVDDEHAADLLDWVATQLRNQQDGTGSRHLGTLYDSWLAAGMEEAPLLLVEQRQLNRARDGDFDAEELAWVLCRRISRWAETARQYTGARTGSEK